jgi:hypothetical protein
MEAVNGSGPILGFLHANHCYERVVSERVPELLDFIEKLPLLKGVIIFLTLRGPGRQHLRL